MRKTFRNKDVEIKSKGRRIANIVQKRVHIYYPITFCRYFRIYYNNANDAAKQHGPPSSTNYTDRFVQELPWQYRMVITEVI